MKIKNVSQINYPLTYYIIRLHVLLNLNHSIFVILIISFNLFILTHKFILQICRRYSLWKRLTWSKTDYWKNSLALWEKFIGRNFYHCPNADQMIKKTKSEISMSKKNYHTLLHRPHYSNIYLLAPDNQVLCTISDSKAAW